MLQCLEQTVFAGNIKKVILSGKEDKPLPNASSYPSSKELTCMFSGLIRLSLWIYIFICLLVSRHLQKIRETVRLWWSALPTTTAPAPRFLFLSWKLKGNLFILPTILRHFQSSKEIDLFYFPMGKRNMTSSSLLKHHFVLLQRENSTSYSP